MRREELEHLLRAIGRLTGEKEVYVFGSQAILAHDLAQDEIIHRSMEADLAIPRDDGEKSNEIEGSLGEGSPFALEYGYYAEGVEEGVSYLPVDWKKRAIRIYGDNTGGVTGVCPEVHDLCASKAIAEREKDWEFIKRLHEVTQLNVEEILRRIDQIDNLSDDAKLRTKRILCAKLGLPDIVHD